MPCRIESPFSFRLVEKKTAIHGQKKRRLGMSWPAKGQLTHTKERPIRTADKIQKSPAGCAESPQIDCIPASADMAFIDLQREPPPPPFSLPLPCTLGKSLDLLFQCLKFSSGEKFIQRDAKTVAQLFNRHNAGILAVSIQDAFNSRCGHTGYIGEVIHRPSSLSAQ